MVTKITRAHEYAQLGKVHRNPVHHDRCCPMRLVTPTIHDTPIVRMVDLRHDAADLFGRCHRRKIRPVVVAVAVVGAAGAEAALA
jgi:hypothetical protein